MIHAEQRKATLKLTTESLANLGPDITVPTYDRAALSHAIVHIGVGSFHRAHQAVYLDDLAQRGITTGWGECGVGLHSPAMKDALLPQHSLYTMVERSARGDQARVVGAMGRYLFAPDDPKAVLAVLADPGTRLVTLTITDSGYHVNHTTGTFDAEDPAVRADLENPAAPTTAFGYLCEALDRRRKAGLAPFSVLSCDNMQDNGKTAKLAVTSFARLRDEALAQWIEANAAFPGSTVDRITPQTTDEDRELVARTFDIDDQWPVITEPFSQWIVEDTFCNGRPPLHEVGVQFVPDIAPYGMMKVRLLNASHSALGYLGYLAGYRSTDEVMGDPLFRTFVERMMDDEVTPLLPDVPGIDLAAYKRTLVERFANPKISDQLDRLCARGSSKLPRFLVPSIKEAVEHERPHTLLDLAVAGWLRYLRGVDPEGNEIEVKDPRKEELQPLAVAGGSNPRPLLQRESDVFGDLAQNEAFMASVEQALYSLDRLGSSETIAAYLGNQNT